MKLKKLVAVIDASAEIFEVSRDTQVCADLRELVGALKTRSSLEMSFVADVLGKSVGNPDRTSLALRRLAEFQRLSGAKKFAVDFELLADQSDGNIAARISNLDLPDYFLVKLRQADLDLVAVQKILKTMASAGMMTPKEAAAVAAMYTNSPASYRNKKAALDAIRDRASRDAGLESKSRQSI